MSNFIKIKGLLNIFIIVLLFIVVFQIPVKASENMLDSIIINVELDDYGNAYIKEEWTLYFPEGTESYINIENLQGSKLRGFKVSSENYGPYENKSPWDIDKSRVEKSNTYGIVEKSTGYELCWGVGEGDKVGTQIYTIEYLLEDFVKKYLDNSTGFNWEFLTHDINPSPKYVKIIISRQDGFIPEDTKIWGFGYDGEINIIDNRIVAECTSSLSNNNYMTILMQTPENYFNIDTTYHKTFEEVKETALIGSDYRQETYDLSELGISGLFSIIPIVLLSLTFPFLPFVILIMVIVLFRKALEVKNLPDIKNETFDYCRDLPFNNDIQNGFYALYLLGRLKGVIKYEYLISGYIMKWVKEGYITVTKGTLKGKVTTGLQLVCNSIDSSESLFEQELFMIFRRASGSDGVLLEKEFNKWAKENSDYIGSVLKNIEKDTQKKFIKLGYLIVKKGFVEKLELTPLGREEIVKMLGFKQYLLDFSLLVEKGVEDVSLWKDYLIWATLFGIADKVEEQLKITNPTYFMEDNRGFDSHTIGHISRSIGTAGAKGYLSSRSSGGGGSSSSGGGGGGSGGGGGGGGSR